MANRSAILRALKALVYTPHIRKYLLETDPKALARAEQAILAATEAITKKEGK